MRPPVPTREEAMPPAVDSTSDGARISSLSSDPVRLHGLDLRSTSGDGSDEQAWWQVRVLKIHDRIVTRAISMVPARLTKKGTSKPPSDDEYRPWTGDGSWTAELDIWPAWHQRPDDEGKDSAPLASVNQHCRRNGERLRESAKWMATVIGLALAALIGTSPLSDLRTNGPSGWAVALGAVGLGLLGVALFLVLWVIRPQPVSYRDIQATEHGPLAKWRKMVETEQDLYLPCGIDCLTTLRQTMIVDELTLSVLTGAMNTSDITLADKGLLERALEGRVARLIELRRAASEVAAIADYYELHRRSTIATYAGGLAAILATAAIVAAFL
jgi:hypothetical protein